MIRLSELIKTIVEKKLSAAAQQAKAAGLVSKPGFGNWGPPNTNRITRRTIMGHLKSVPPHWMGQKPEMTGKPKKNPALINIKGIPTRKKPPEVKFPLFPNRVNAQQQEE